MSEIFDALQRSEADLSGTQISELKEAIGVLQRVERRAACRGRYHEDEGQEQHEAVAPEVDVLDLVRTESRRSSPSPIPGKAEMPSDDADLLQYVKSRPMSLLVDSKLVSVTEPESAAAEAFRLLAVRLQEIRNDRGLKRLLITSTIPQEGKSMVAANVACSLARGRQEKVLLLEGDIRRPTLSPTLGVQGGPGICEWTRDEVSLAQSIVYLSDAGLWALLAGNAAGNSSDSLQSQKLAPLMEQLSDWFDWIIIDSPPVLALADTSVWSALAEGILLVTRYGRTQKKELLRGIKSIDPQKVVGTVLNCSSSSPHSDYYYLSTCDRK